MVASNIYYKEDKKHDFIVERQRAFLNIFSVYDILKSASLFSTNFTHVKLCASVAQSVFYTILLYKKLAINFITNYLHTLLYICFSIFLTSSMPTLYLSFKTYLFCIFSNSFINSSLNSNLK